ncbi:MAG: VWA domain-containing protein [Pseudomonadales bacterium]|nr:VWA domain-containing protein [Pseudomonadales bacterium]MCP5347594.1 VWA domain-containing protein [Pseudomonadales bacterium]
MASNKQKRRAFNPLSLAFLDVMSCGFGAVVLLFLILDHAAQVDATEGDAGVTAEIDLLEEEVRDGQAGLVEIRNTLDEVSLDVVTAQGLARQIQQQIDDFMQELAALENNSLARVESVDQLRADVQALEEELQRLQASAVEQEGNSVRQFLGDGDRQYLSGLYLGGNRILILVDRSASMLDETLVNIIRTRNMSDDAKRNAPKWQRVVKIVDWVSSQLPITSRYQVYSFSDQTAAALDGTEGQWLEVADRDQLNKVIDQVKGMVPDAGTNMAQVFQKVAQMNPPPDNIFLITDGLPTLGNGRNRDTLVTPRQRLELFEDAVDVLPEGIPVNVVLMPLEGDPSAAAAYWQLAQYSRGSFLSPSKDWP